MASGVGAGRRTQAMAGDSEMKTRASLLLRLRQDKAD
jgi:hypothetical protein